MPYFDVLSFDLAVSRLIPQTVVANFTPSDSMVMLSRWMCLRLLFL